jgi:hypothetical protein
MHRLRILASSSAVVLVALLAACSDTPTTPEVSANAAPDFGLMDVNPSSPRHGRLVLVRDYRTTVSAWYFGHAT